MISKKELILAATVSTAIAIAILSMPDVMEPIAKSIISRLGYLLPLAVFVVGIIHGLKPDEHTWPITISYAMMQRTVIDAVKSTVVFGMALTTVWTALSALVGQVMGLGLASGVFNPQVDVVVGLTMIGVALFYLYKSKEKGPDADGGGTAVASAPDFKLIWIHGTAAAFGGDFFVVLLLSATAATISPGVPTFVVGLLFGTASTLAQLVIVLLAYRGLIKSVKQPQLLVNAGKLSLLFLGAFMIGLGIYYYLTST